MYTLDPGMHLSWYKKNFKHKVNGNLPGINIFGRLAKLEIPQREIPSIESFHEGTFHILHLDGRSHYRMSTFCSSMLLLRHRLYV